jgi:phosphate uptake regulator
MESRKLISFGNSSLIISLPAPWVKKNRLVKGDEVFVTEIENGLLVTKKEAPRKDIKFITIDANDKNTEQIKTEIISGYLRNYDVIEILNKKGQDMEEIKNITRNLSGTEIIEETSSKIVVKYLIDIKEISIESLIRRIDVITRNMLEDTIKCFKEDLHKSIAQRDLIVNRLVLLAHRTIRCAFENSEIARQFGMGNIELLNSFDVITNLEKIADSAKRASRIMATLKKSKKMNQEIEKIFIGLNERYLKAMKAHYSKNKELAFDVELESQNIVAEINDCLSKNQDLCFLRMSEFCKNIVANTKFIARVTIDGN